MKPSRPAATAMGWTRQRSRRSTLESGGPPRGPPISTGVGVASRCSTTVTAILHSSVSRLGGRSPTRPGPGRRTSSRAAPAGGETATGRRSGRVGRVTDAPNERTPRPSTVGELRESGWVSVPVREEVRRNALARIAAGLPVVAGVLGFEHSVIPQLEHALLAGHDIILLGERGQAKSRIIRSLVDLLDPFVPALAGSEVHDDPFRPASRQGRDLVAELGDKAPITWVGRDERYAEKLATPDTTIADLIGEVDPIKVAEGRYLSDELTIHYGMVPRTNRGVFCINELPDLAERSQVGLLNIMEVRDVQIRGYKVRLPLDLYVVASANPEDYTNRGRIITPLKDRIGSEIRTHYPRTVEGEISIMEQEAVAFAADGYQVTFPQYMKEIVAETTHLARKNPEIS